MPFISQVSIARSVSGLTGKESISSASTVNKLSREEKGGSVKERITMNLKNLGKKEQPRSGGPTKGGGAEGKRRNKLKVPKQAGSTISTGAVPASPSQGSMKVADAELRSRMEVQEEEAHFTLTLTPEAVLLLQKRSSERPHRACGGAAEIWANGRQRENPSKRRSTSSHRVSPKTSGEPEIDLRSILKISLLNEQHKYDDVEYEEEEYGLDQRVALKCTEWLRGLESPLTVAVTTTGGVTGVTTAGGVRGF